MDGIESVLKTIGGIAWQDLWGVREAVVCDLHGVVMDVSKEYQLADQLYARNTEAWYAFLRNYPTFLHDERPIGDGKAVLKRIKTRYVLVGLTGVVEDVVRRAKISLWLKHWGYPDFDILFMRPRSHQEEHLNSVELDGFYKAEVIKLIHHSIARIRLVIDDKEGILEHIKAEVGDVNTFLFEKPSDWRKIVQLLEV